MLVHYPDRKLIHECEEVQGWELEVKGEGTRYVWGVRVTAVMYDNKKLG